MTAPTRVSLIGWGLLGCFGLVACSQRVAVTPPAPDPVTAELCRTFTGQLPDQLSTAGARRSVTPDSPLTAAYGDPPVGIRCGVQSPPGLTATSLLVTVDGVDWLPEELTAGWRLTTVGRAANVELTVPTAQGPAPGVAADLGPVVSATIPRADA